MHKIELIPPEKIENAILLIRGKRVMLDSDLAEMYEVKTSRLNEQVKRNSLRFPSDFMFQLTNEEKDQVINCSERYKRIKFSRTNPYVFTEYGAIMLASVLNTVNAINASVLIVRAFVKLREIMSTHKDLEKKILDMESKYEFRFKLIFQAIKQLMNTEAPEKERAAVGYKIPKK